jgi:DHA2 family multidrug resistance protein
MPRNTGGSIGISLANNVVAHRAQFHQNRLVEFVNPSGSQYQDTLKQMTDYFLVHGSSFAQAPQQAFTWISQQVQLQASYLACIDSSGFFQRHKISFKKSLRRFA